MTLNLRIQHRGGPYWAHVNETMTVEEGLEKVVKTTVLKNRGDEVEVAIWKGKAFYVNETDPFENDAYA